MPSSRAQDTQLNLNSTVRDRFNRRKPDFVFRNGTELIDFLIDIYDLVKPLIYQGLALSDKEVKEIISNLYDKRKFVKEIEPLEK
jgi:hypothetical protein